MSVAAIVLAAGASHRLGRPKQNILLAGETLLERTIRVAGHAGLSPVIVVCRPEHTGTFPQTGIITGLNEEADEGVASSIRCGVALAHRERVSGAVILTCDQPTVRADHLRALVKSPTRITGSAYGSSVGVPAYFPAEHFTALMQLRGDIGARSLLKTANAIESEDLNLDIDTEEDLRMARTLLETHQSTD